MCHTIHDLPSLMKLSTTSTNSSSPPKRPKRFNFKTTLSFINHILIFNYFSLIHKSSSFLHPCIQSFKYSAFRNYSSHNKHVITTIMMTLSTTPQNNNNNNINVSNNTIEEENTKTLNTKSKCNTNDNNRTTTRTKKLFNFTEARKLARGHGFSNLQEFLNYDCPGAYQLPKNIPELYVEEFTTWDDFLGIAPNFEEGRMVTRQLNIMSEDEYYEFIRNDAKSNMDTVESRLPFRPDLYYKNEWISWDDWLGH